MRTTSRGPNKGTDMARPVRAVAIGCALLLSAFTAWVLPLEPAAFGQDRGEPNCNNMTTLALSSQLCEGESQSNCSMQSEANSTGTKKDRAVINPDCANKNNWRCYQAEVPCWTEYTCTWNASEERCENDQFVASATTMAKLTEACQ